MSNRYKKAITEKTITPIRRIIKLRRKDLIDLAYTFNRIDPYTVVIILGNLPKGSLIYGYELIKTTVGYV